MAAALEHRMFLPGPARLLRQRPPLAPICREPVLRKPMTDRGDASVQLLGHLAMSRALLHQDPENVLLDPALIGMLPLIHRLQAVLLQVVADRRRVTPDS